MITRSISAARNSAIALPLVALHPGPSPAEAPSGAPVAGPTPRSSDPSRRARVSSTGIGRGALAVANSAQTSGSSTALVGSELRSALRDAVGRGSAQILYVSESDEPVEPFVHAGRGGAINEAAIRHHLGGALQELAEGHATSIGQIAVIRLDPAFASEFLERLSTSEAGEAPLYAAMHAGFGRVLDVMRANLGPDIAVFKAGPRGSDGGLDEDTGKYLYVIAGRSADGGLAGVRFAAVET